MSSMPSGSLSAHSAGEITLLACAHAIVRLRTDGNRAWWACETCGIPFSPAGSPVDPIDATPAPEYLSIRQLADRIPYSEGAIRNMMSRGVSSPRRSLHQAERWTAGFPLAGRTRVDAVAA